MDPEKKVSSKKYFLTKTGAFCFLLLLFSFAVAAQSYSFRHYQVENGLSNNAVICSAQDKDGFLWFGTKDGLDRFDGYTFKIFRNNPSNEKSIGSNFIHSLYIDKNNSLWVGTDKGLFSYNATDESFERLTTPFYEQVTDIKMDTHNNLWFVSNFNLFKYNPDNKRLQHFTIPEYSETTSVCTLPDGSVWVSTTNGLLKKYNSSSNSFEAFNLFAHSPGTVSDWIEKLYATTDGNILAGTSNQGVKLFDTKSSSYKDILTYNEDGTEIFARNFTQPSDSICWIATETGIYVYNLKTNQYINLRKDYNNPYSISDNAVYTFCKDKEGGIWAGTYFGGVNYHSNPQIEFTKYFPQNDKNSLSGNVVREIHEDKYGNLWIGTEDGGLDKYDRKKNLFRSFMPGTGHDKISYSNIHGLLPYNDELWIGTFEHGLDIMNIKTGKVTRHYAKGNDPGSLKSNFIYCLYKTDDDEILVGTTIGAYRYDKEKNNFSLLEDFPLYNWYSYLYKDKSGTIWACTYGNGVYYYNTRTKKSGNFTYNPADTRSIASDRVNSVFEDSDNNTWFATENGLCLLEKGKDGFIRYTSANGLPSDFTLSILEDGNKDLWISTSKGLANFNRITKRIIVYSRTNGLLNDQFNFNSAYKDSSGRLYFGSVKGMISFNPSRNTGKQHTTPVFITGIQVNNKELNINEKGSPISQSVTYTGKIVLKHNQSTFSIDFASLSFTSPEMTGYAYLMEGLNPNWTELATNQRVYFTELKPGSYTFHVKAKLHDGTEYGPETKLIITIQPSIWQSNLAYLVYMAVVLFIIIFLIRTYNLRQKEKNQHKIDQLQTAKEKELYEAKLQFFSNVAHEIKTPLTLIKGPLEKVIRKAGDNPDIKDSLRIMEKNTSRLIDLSSQLLDFRETEIKGYSLNFTQANINEMVEEVVTGFRQLAEQKNIRVTSRMPEQQIYAYIDTEAFTKVISNLMDNAIKYADTKVAVSISPVTEHDKNFILEITNDGYLIPDDMKEKIFEPFFRLKETEKKQGTGIGLALARSLTLLQSGTLGYKRSENNLNTFFVTFPVYKLA